MKKKFFFFFIFFTTHLFALTPSEEKLANRINTTSKMGISYGIKFQLRNYSPESLSNILNHKIKGETSLIIASKGGHKKTAKALLKRGADPNIEDNINKRTPLIWSTIGKYRATNDILINCKPETNQYIKPIYNGFSFRSADGSSSSKNSITGANSMLPNIRGINPDISNIGFKLGSLLLGRYYNVPNNPELNLTMTTEMDGISAIKTKGGTDLMDAEYLRSPDWGNLQLGN